MNRSKIELKFSQVMIPVITMPVLILLTILVWKAPIHLALFFELVVTIVLAILWKFSWSELEEMMLNGLAGFGRVVIIMLLIGILIGVWIGTGAVPTMIYYGLKIISPQYFILTSFLLSSIVSLAIGTAIGTASTIGLALVSIGIGLNIPLPLVAGAIISGAYFGDRTSPVSAVAITTAHSAGAELNVVIKHMIYTVLPPYLISALLYLLLGQRFSINSVSTEQVDLLITNLEHYFQISPLLLIPPILIIILAFKGFPTIPNLAVSIHLSLGMGLIIVGKDMSFLLKSMFYGFNSNTGIQVLDQLLSRGGLISMLELISLIILASLLGGLFEGLGVLQVLLERLMGNIKRNGQLIFGTMVSGLLASMLGCNQLLAVFLPGKMLARKYDQMGVSRKDLARALADSGLILSPLIPWNINGLMMSGILGVATFSYLPYSFLPLLLPLVSAIFGFTGFTINKTEVKAFSS